MVTDEEPSLTEVFPDSSPVGNKSNDFFEMSEGLTLYFQKVIIFNSISFQGMGAV